MLVKTFSVGHNINICILIVEIYCTYQYILQHGQSKPEIILYFGKTLNIIYYFEIFEKSFFDTIYCYKL